MVATVARISIDLGELSDRIDSARKDDPAWCELSLAGKVRVLIEERLREVERQDGKNKSPAP